MASLYGVVIKNLKTFKDHEGMIAYQGDVWFNNKKLGFWSQDSWCGSDHYDFKESLLDAVVNRFKKSSLLEDKYRDIANLDIMLNHLVNLIEQEKEYKKGVKKGYPTYVRATDGFHILGYYTRQLAADVKKDEYYQSFLEKCNTTMFKDWNKQVNIYDNIENFNIY